MAAVELSKQCNPNFFFLRFVIAFSSVAPICWMMPIVEKCQIYIVVICVSKLSSWHLLFIVTHDSFKMQFNLMEDKFSIGTFMLKLPGIYLSIIAKNFNPGYFPRLYFVKFARTTCLWSTFKYYEKWKLLNNNIIIVFLGNHPNFIEPIRPIRVNLVVHVSLAFKRNRVH